MLHAIPPLSKGDVRRPSTLHPPHPIPSHLSTCKVHTEAGVPESTGGQQPLQAKGSLGLASLFVVNRGILFVHCFAMVAENISHGARLVYWGQTSRKFGS